MLFEGPQEALDGAGEKPQPGQMRHVGGDLGRVQSLLLGGEAGGLDHLPGHVREDLPGHVIGADQGAEVVENLLAGMRLDVVDIEGVLPTQVELQGAQHVIVRELVHLLEHARPDQRGHRNVGASVVRTVEGEKGLLVDERQDLFPERSGPCFVESRNTLGR